MTNVTLANAIEHTDEEICEAIKGKVFSLGDLQNPQCQFPLDRIDNIKQLIDKEEEDAWDKVKDSDDVNSIDDFLKSYPNSKHADEADGIKETIQEKKDADEAWKIVDKKSLDSLKNYKQNYPNFHSDDIASASDKITWEKRHGSGYEALKAEIDNTMLSLAGMDRKTIEDNIIKTIDVLFQNKKIKKADLLRVISEDPNLFHVSSVNSLKDKDYFDDDDLINGGIDECFVYKISANDPKKPQLKDSGTLINLDKRKKEKATEVYFWGIPSSGKSCALGAILSAANNGKIAKTLELKTDCQGYEYMNNLSTLFDKNNGVFVLPEGTSEASTYEMSFDLVDQQGYRHPITLIDLAGELMMCMYDKDTHHSIDGKKDDSLSNIDKLLGNTEKNCRKIHFFVLEYGAENRMYRGIKQDKCLYAALNHIKKTGIFNKNTDAIYLLVTKTDKIKETEKKNVLKKYIEDNCRSFYNGLRQVSMECSINGGNKSNGGRVGVFAFSLGTVVFHDFCKYDESAAISVVKELLQRTGKIKNNILAK